MKKLVLGTLNPAKLNELRFGLQELSRLGVELVDLVSLGITLGVKETGETFIENARLKAEAYAKLTGLPTLADDGGLEIDVLNGAPGVRSRRWLGYKADDAELIKHTLEMLKGMEGDKRRAHLTNVVCFYNPETGEFDYSKQKISGFVAKKPSNRPIVGYPFRALFIVEEYNKYYDELTTQEHLQVNHRLKGLQELLPKMKKALL